MLKIGDFSQMGQVSVRMLRHYDDMGLLKPAQIDPFTGYRYYAVDQLARLNRILALKDLGLSLEQIALLLERDLPPDYFRKLLEAKHQEIARQITEEQARLARVAARLRQIEQEGAALPYEVVLKQVEPCHIAAIRQVVPHVHDMATVRCTMYQQLYHTLAQHHLEPGQPEMALYHNAEYSDENIDMTAAVTLSSLPHTPLPILQTLPAVETMASVVHHGSMWDVPQAIMALYRWIGENGYSSAGAYREIHLFWRELEEPDFEHIALELQVPILLI